MKFWRWTRWCAVAAVLAATAVAGAAPKAEEDVPDPGAGKSAPSWAKPVEGFKPPAPGEHPRLFFRKSALPALRQKAQTPEGKQIVEQLRRTLGGGDAMPTVFSQAKQAYDEAAPRVTKQIGAFTVSHPAGYGMLYQLTGDKKYAVLARQSLDKLFAGQRDKDDRYAWVAPGGNLRAGPVLGWVAMAYDLNYDAWPEDYRRQVLEKIQGPHDKADRDPQEVTLYNLVYKPRHFPGSNHWGAQVGGALPNYAKYLVRLAGIMGVGGAALSGDLDRQFATSAATVA